MRLKTKTNFFILATACLLSSSIAFASPMSSSLTLNDVAIKPGQIGDIPLDKLYSGVPYELRCMIKGEGSSREYKTVMFYTKYIPEQIPLTVGGSNVPYNTAKLIELNKEVIVVRHIQDYMSFSIRNLDYTDTITTSCIVTPET